MRYMHIMLVATLLAALAVPASAQVGPAPPPDARVIVHVQPRHGGADVRAERSRVQRGRGDSVQTDRITRTVHLGPSGEVDLSNVAGDIVVTRGQGNETTIEVTKTARGATEAEAKEMLALVRVDLVERGGRLEVRTRYPDGDRPRRAGRSIHVTVALAVTTPAGTRVRAQSVAGSVSVENITGEVAAESVSGDVRIANGGRILAVKSISGNVEVTGAAADRPLHASTVSGNVLLRKVKADHIEAAAVSGEIVLDDVTCARLKAQTVSGDVRFSGTLPSNGRFHLGSHSGSVQLGLRSASGFDLEASSFSGTVRSDFPLTVQPGVQQAGRGRTNALRGTHGDGAAFLSLTTFSGNITIAKR